MNNDLVELVAQTSYGGSGKSSVSDTAAHADIWDTFAKCWEYEDKQGIVPVPEEFMSRKGTCKPVTTVFCEQCSVEAYDLW